MNDDHDIPVDQWQHETIGAPGGAPASVQDIIIPPDEAMMATIPSPAMEELDSYAQRALATGTGIPEPRLKDDADPLLVRSLTVLERIIAGGLISPWSQEVQEECRKLIVLIREKVSCTKDSDSRTITT